MLNSKTIMPESCWKPVISAIIISDITLKKCAAFASDAHVSDLRQYEFVTNLIHYRF